VRSTHTHGSETWPMKEEHEVKLDRGCLGGCVMRGFKVNERKRKHRT